jgi:catechol 2,3-dioxygenase-like lactoylglutathione lyase family enzyme
VRARVESVKPVLMCSDVPASIRFYERLGFTLSFQDDPASPKYAGVERDGAELYLQWHDQAQRAQANDRPTYRFLVREVDALYAELLANDAVTEQAGASSPWSVPGDTPWGTREFHLRDPDGNGLQFYRRR